MELLLWRWSTTAQVASALLIAVFFAVLGRSMRRAELRPWIQAWLANLGALVVTIVFWFARPPARLQLGTLIWGYFFFKTLFAVLLAWGAWRVIWPHARARTRIMVAAVALVALVPAAVVTSVGGIGVVQSTVIRPCCSGVGGSPVDIIACPPQDGSRPVTSCARRSA